MHSGGASTTRMRGWNFAACITNLFARLLLTPNCGQCV